MVLPFYVSMLELSYGKIKLREQQGGIMTVKVIIFDKDGTLVSASDAWQVPSINAVDDILQQSSLTNEEKIQLKEQAGIVGGQLLPNSLFISGSIREQSEFFAPFVDLSIGELDELLINHYMTFQDEHTSPSLLEPGALELLETLTGQGYKLAIVTNDNYALTHHMLERVGIMQYFDFIGCADQYGSKPNPRSLHELCRQLDVRLSEMVYVGDSEVDMEYGQYTRAAIGYSPTGDADFLEAADYIIDHLLQVTAVVEQLNQSSDEEELQ